VSSFRRYAGSGGCRLACGEAEMGCLEDVQPKLRSTSSSKRAQTLGQGCMGRIRLGVPVSQWTDESTPAAMRGLRIPHHGVLRGLPLRGGAIPYVS